MVLSKKSANQPIDHTDEEVGVSSALQQKKWPLQSAALLKLAEDSDSR